MLTVVDSLIVELGLDPSQFDKGSKDVAARLAGFKRNAVVTAKESEEQLKKISDAFDGMVKKAVAFVGSFLGARALVNFAKDVIETNRSLGNMADVMQENISKLSALGGVFERLGGSSQGIIDTIYRMDKEMKAMNIGAADPMQSEMMKFINALSTFGVNVNPVDAKKNFRGAADIFIEVAEKLAKSNLPAGTKVGLLRELGLDTDTIGVTLRGGEAMRAYLKEQEEKVYVVTDEQRKKTDEINKRWKELTQLAKRLGQEGLIFLADGLEKVLAILMKSSDWLGKMFSDPNSILYLPSLARVKEALGPGGTASGGGGGEGGGVSGQGAMGGSVRGHAVDAYGGLTGRKLYEPMTGWMGGGVGGHSAKFGPGQHEGVDVMGPVGSPIYAIDSGTVVTAPTKGGGTDQVLTIDHGNGFYSRLLHQGPGNVKPGDHVDGGSVVGTSGFRNAAHSHVEMWKGKPGASGSKLMNPKAIFGWDKSNPAVGGRAVVVGEQGHQSQQQQASKAAGGGWPAPLTAVPFMNLSPMLGRKPVVSNSSRTEINSVTVHSQATDASGIAADIRAELQRQMRESLPSQQFINARTPQEADAAMAGANRVAQ